VDFAAATDKGLSASWIAAAIVPLRSACQGIARTAPPRSTRPAGSALHLWQCSLRNQRHL